MSFITALLCLCLSWITLTWVKRLFEVPSSARFHTLRCGYRIVNVAFGIVTQDTLIEQWIISTLLILRLITLASLVMLVDGALVNALAFSRSTYVFRMLGNPDVEEERKRRHEANEQFQAAQAEWFGRRSERLYCNSDELSHQSHTVQTFQDVDDAICEYTQAFVKPFDPLFIESR